MHGSRFWPTLRASNLVFCQFIVIYHMSILPRFVLKIWFGVDMCGITHEHVFVVCMCFYVKVAKRLPNITGRVVIQRNQIEWLDK